MALLALLETHAVERARTRLHHDPSDDRSAFGIVFGRPAPDIVEDVERDLLGDLATAANTHREREHDAMRALVERAQGPLITSGDRLDQAHPLTLPRLNRGGGSITIEQVSELRRGFLRER